MREKSFPACSQREKWLGFGIIGIWEEPVLWWVLLQAESQAEKLEVNKH